MMSSCGTSLARPKSRTLTWPAFVMKTFPGLRSRWTMPLLVRGGEPARDLEGHVLRLGGGQGSFGEPLAQGLPLEELHHGVGDAALAAEVVDGQDVGVGQRGHGLGFPLEPRQGVRIPGQLLGDHLHRHEAVQPRVPRLVHLSHPPRTDGGEDFVRAELRAGGEAQRASFKLSSRGLRGTAALEAISI